MSRGVDKSIRVLVANRPRLMRELMISTISDQSDIEVVGEVQNEADIWEVIEQTRPDFLIVASDEFGMQPPSVCASILRAYPQMKIIAITPSLNSGMFCWASLFIHTNEIEASEEGVLRALRGKSQPIAGIQ